MDTDTALRVIELLQNPWDSGMNNQDREDQSIMSLQRRALVVAWSTILGEEPPSTDELEQAA